MPPASGVPSRPTAWRRISAPGELGRGRPARPGRRRPPSGRPGRARPTGRGTAPAGGPRRPAGRPRPRSARRRRTRADQRTLASWWAPTTDVAGGLGEQPQRRPTACGATAPAPARRSRRPRAAAPVTVISSHASSWLRYTWPRRCPPGRQQRRAAAARGGPARRPRALGVLAVDQGHLDVEEQLPVGARAEHRQEPGVALVGRVELDDERRPVRVDDGLGPALEPLRHLGAGGDGRLEGRAVETGDDGLGHVGGVRVTGGGAGSSSRPAASLAMASTTAPSTSSVRVLGSALPRAVIGPGHGRGQAADGGLVDQGRHPADVELEGVGVRPALAAEAAGRSGPGPPGARPSTATRPSQVTLAPRPSPPCAAAHGDQPAERLVDGIDRASAWTPPGQRDAGVRPSSPWPGAPIASRRSASSSLSAGADAGAAGPHARPRRPTTRPAAGPRRRDRPPARRRRRWRPGSAGRRSTPAGPARPRSRPPPGPARRP